MAVTGLGETDKPGAIQELTGVFEHCTLVSFRRNCLAFLCFRIFAHEGIYYLVVLLPTSFSQPLLRYLKLAAF